MNRDQAMTIVLAEAFSENGLAVLVHDAREPGWERINNLIGALNYLANQLADDDCFGREFVSALFSLGNDVPDLLRAFHPDGPLFRPSLYDQASDLTVAVSNLIENWNNWPDYETHPLRAYNFQTPSENGAGPTRIERVGGYAVGDITYCENADTIDCFPVRVERLGNGYLDVVPLGGATSMCAQFVEDNANRRFFLPVLTPGARFGGCDERMANSERKSGPELRLLPQHYATTTRNLIRERHATDPVRWPLPTGLIFDRWFHDTTPSSGEEP